ncbi:hypothetical protein ANCCAN_08309 [Ancylostoma caninum]|uniref:Uncharacterized protein n=1 Tax=Ancylostoma caninum TaxID=29170 RepID=A0A368GMP9_ANCCA|nr:hypothetical protein ANCCAN_08309 [Ancylostoma caninum]
MLDRILPIISQLKQKGENTNPQHMRRTILGKFMDKVQRSMLKKKANLANAECTTLRSSGFFQHGRSDPTPPKKRSGIRQDGLAQ